MIYVVDEVHYDKHKLIVHDGDGGDSAQRSGMELFLLRILHGDSPDTRRRYAWIVNKLYTKDGLIRHPDPQGHKPPLNDPEDVSGDQTEAFMLGCAMFDVNYVPFNMWEEIKNRGFKYQNGKYIKLHVIPTIIRMGLMKGTKLLPLWDLTLLIYVIMRMLLRGTDRTNTGDDLNLAMHIIFASMRYQNRIIKLCQTLYNPEPSFDLYFRKKSIRWNRLLDTGNPNLNDVYRPVLHEVFGRTK